MPNITLKDVAKEAGVSISTVSRVIREQNSVRPETRKKVMRAIKKLNYYVDTTAGEYNQQVWL